MQVDVSLGSFGVGSANVTLQVVDALAGLPSGAVLGSLTQADPPNGWCTFDLSPAGVTLQQGSSYGIVLSDDDANGAGDPSRYVQVRWSNAYAGGALWDHSTGTWAPTMLSGTTPGDMAFRTWMVPVPEPATPSALLPLLLPLLRRTRFGARPRPLNVGPLAPTDAR
jgi:hypothetical protein